MAKEDSGMDSAVFIMDESFTGPHRVQNGGHVDVNTPQKDVMPIPHQPMTPKHENTAFDSHLHEKHGHFHHSLHHIGSGKTTLLNTITQRINTQSLTASGDVRVNGVDVGSGIRNISAYVQQDDLFIATMTALLRMEKEVSRLLLMAEGRVAFMGEMNHALEVFKRSGFPCPVNFNPADFYIHTMAVMPGKETECKAQIEYDEAFSNTSRYEASIFTQFRAVFARSWKTMIREPMVMRVRVIQTVVLALLLGLIYLQVDNDQEGVMNVNGVLFLVLTNMTFTSVFGVLNSFPIETPIFLREYGYIVSAAANSVSTALAIGPPLMIPLLMFGGFFLNSDSIPVYFIWLEYLSWFKYANELLADKVWLDLGLLFAMLVAYRIVAFIILFVKARRSKG
ncbi:WHITE-like protein [Mya arenaria]|uniref:WHITE-like protein n=1 Tax=Mya arenaria TaxID=6604 RepID=A0ABY7FKW8_MYAAR|nr:WHITE-like protein [Mya arenaria]